MGILGIEATEAGKNAETDGYRREAASERKCRPNFKSMLCDRSCSRPGEKHAGC
jgi:hypothetical protein